LIVSNKFLAKLSDADKAIVREAGKAACTAEVEATIEGEKKGLGFIKGKGVEVIADIDLGPFKSKMGPVYELAAKQVGQDLIDEAKRVA